MASGNNSRAANTGLGNFYTRRAKDAMRPASGPKILRETPDVEPEMPPHVGLPYMPAPPGYPIDGGGVPIPGTKPPGAPQPPHVGLPYMPELPGQPIDPGGVPIPGTKPRGGGAPPMPTPTPYGNDIAYPDGVKRRRLFPPTGGFGRLIGGE